MGGRRIQKNQVIHPAGISAHEAEGRILSITSVLHQSHMIHVQAGSVTGFHNAFYYFRTSFNWKDAFCLLLLYYIKAT